MSHPNTPDRFALEQQARELRRAEIARLTTAAIDALLVTTEKAVIAIARALRRARLAHRERTAHVANHAFAH